MLDRAGAWSREWEHRVAIACQKGGTSTGSEERLDSREVLDIVIPQRLEKAFPVHPLANPPNNIFILEKRGWKMGLQCSGVTR